jgi:cell division protein FtsX
MKNNLEKRLEKIRSRKIRPQVYIMIPAHCSEDGKEHWKGVKGEIKKPKLVEGDHVIVDDIRGMEDVRKMTPEQRKKRIAELKEKLKVS